MDVSDKEKPRKPRPKRPSTDEVSAAHDAIEKLIGAPLSADKADETCPENGRDGSENEDS